MAPVVFQARKGEHMTPDDGMYVVGIREQRVTRAGEPIMLQPGDPMPEAFTMKRTTVATMLARKQLFFVPRPHLPEGHVAIPGADLQMIREELDRQADRIAELTRDLIEARDQGAIFQKEMAERTEWANELKAKLDEQAPAPAGPSKSLVLALVQGLTKGARRALVASLTPDGLTPDDLGDAWLVNALFDPSTKPATEAPAAPAAAPADEPPTDPVG